MKLSSKNSFLKRIACIILSAMLCLTSFTLAGFVPTLEAEAATGSEVLHYDFSGSDYSVGSIDGSNNSSLTTPDNSYSVKCWTKDSASHSVGNGYYYNCDGGFYGAVPETIKNLSNWTFTYKGYSKEHGNTDSCEIGLGTAVGNTDIVRVSSNAKLYIAGEWKADVSLNFRTGDDYSPSDFNSSLINTIVFEYLANYIFVNVNGTEYGPYAVSTGNIGSIYSGVNAGSNNLQGSHNHFVDDIMVTKADDISVLQSVMQKFEAKMDGSVYTNMDAAYNAYVAASKAYDAAYYGGDTAVDIVTPANNLLNAMAGMHKWSAFKGTAVGYFGETVATEGYTNLLYCSTNIGYGSEATASNMVIKMDAPSNSVMLYDGTETGFPVVLEIKRDDNYQRDARYVAVANSSFKLTHNWYGYLENDWTHWPAKTASSNNGELSYSSSVSKTWTLTTKTTRYFNNQCFYNGTGNTTDYFDFFDKNLSFTGCHNRNGATCTSTLSDSRQYVVNYKALIDKMPDSDSRLNSVENYKEGGLGLSIIKASNDPNSYFVGKNDSTVGEAVQLLAGDIKDFVNGNDTLSPDNTANYPALRNAMDNAMSTYKAGMGDYTYRSYNQFKTAYESAQNVMKDVIKNGYIVNSFADKAAENLNTAFEKLETPKANITFENLFSFEDFYNSKSAEQGSLTSASFDRANKTMTLVGTGDVSTVHGGENLYMIPVEPGKTYRLELDVEASNNYSREYCDVMAFLPNEQGTSYDENKVSWRGYYTSDTWRNLDTHKSIEFTIPADYPKERSKIFFRFGTIYDTQNNDKREVTVTYKNIVFYDVDRAPERGDLTDLAVTELGVTEKSVTPGQPYGDLPTPTRDGYVFEGWFTDDKEFKNQITAETIAVAGQSATNLYAKWHAHNYKYEVTLTQDGDKYTWNGKCSCGETDKLGEVDDASAYNKAIESAKSSIENTVKYKPESIENLRRIVNDNKITKDVVKTKEQVEECTRNIVSANQLKTTDESGVEVGVLELRQYTVNFNTVEDDNGTELNVSADSYDYGSVVTLKKDGITPYKWMISDKKVAGATDEFTLVVTSDTKINAYYYSQTAPSNQHVVSVYGRHGKLIGCMYVENGKTLRIDGSSVTDGTSTVTHEKLPFYQVIGYKLLDGTSIDGYEVTQDIDIYPIYNEQKEIVIKLDKSNANIYF